MGRRHVRVLETLADRFDLVGAYDVDPRRQPPRGVASFDSEADALGQADVLVVATPVEAHAATVARALGARKQVFAEKPLCTRADEALSLALRAGPDARLFVGHSERFNPVVRALARLLRQDPATAIAFTRVGPSSPGSPGVLLNLGVHDFDLAAYLGRGEVSLRRVAGAAAVQSRGDDVAHVLFESTSGVTGSIYVDRNAPTRRRAVRLATARWTYEGDLVAHRLTRTSRSTGRCSEVPLAHEEPLVAQAIALADALDAGSGAPAREIAEGFDGARAVSLAERAAGGAGRVVAGAENLSLLGSP
jgi:predicted dehydrogenase